MRVPMPRSITIGILPRLRDRARLLGKLVEDGIRFAGSFVARIQSQVVVDERRQVAFACRASPSRSW